ncbi:MAG: class A beta-lactamase-related serine hydrolase [Gemmatimonadota bacterium]|nr:class A beta-lactamase-related serine hydrolase [Gemmatimonadota bacterium]
MRHNLLAILIALPAWLPAQAPAPARGAPAFARADTASLRRTLDSLAAAHRGVVGYSVHNLDTGERLSRRGDEKFPTASLIKVAVLVTVYDLVEKGLMSPDDRLTMAKVDRVPGSGTLQFMHDGLELTVRDAAWLMSTISDNTATNLLLDKVGIRRVWEKMDSLGLRQTRIHAKVFLARFTSVAPDSSAKYGLGVTTPNEMARLFALLADGRAVSARADSTMLDILARGEDYQMMQRYVTGVRAPRKTGATDQVRTECALFYLQSRVATCVFTRENQDRRWLIDNEAQLTLAKMGQVIAAAWPRRQGGG